MKTLCIERQGPVAHLTLSRPEVHNALHPSMMAQLTEAFSTLAQDAHVRAAVLAAAGKSFCAGADLGWMRETLAYTQEQNEADAARMARMFEAIETFPKPLVVRVQGAALGGGVGLVACGDIAVACEGAVFGLTEVRLGIIPAVISPYVVRKIGVSHARRYFLSGERFDAATAQRLGLVHEVVPEEQLDAAVGAQLEMLLQGGPRAQAQAKDLIRLVAHQAPHTVVKEAARRIARVRVEPEAQEGFKAFFEKRKPDWVGRT